MTASAEPRTTADTSRPDRALVRLWLGVLLPPASWVLDFVVRTFAVRFVNVHQRRWPLHASTLVALAGLGVGVWLCWRTRREAQDPTMLRLATWGLALAGFFLLLLLVQAFPTFLLGPREIA